MKEMVIAPEQRVYHTVFGLGHKDPIKIFFAGSIDNGMTEEWQDKLFRDINDTPTEAELKKDIVCFNPRRKNWSKLEEDKLTEQIEWELNHIDVADLVVVYFADDSYSPITMLELGTLLARHKNIVIYCSPKFYRYRNIRVTSERYGYSVCETYEEFLDSVNGFIINKMMYRKQTGWTDYGI
jgi:nucleoside 2-deoxyribosyltransferase